MSLLRNLNIQAFCDLKEVYYFNGQRVRKKLSEIDEYNSFIGLFKCHNNLHKDYYSYIWDRFDKNKADKGCPYCFFEKKGDILLKCILHSGWGTSKISYIYYCNSCKRIQYYDNKEESILDHVCSCKSTPEAKQFYNKFPLLNQSDPIISRELDDSNNIIKSSDIRDYNLENIPETTSFYGYAENDNENLLFEFKCHKCNEKYKTTINLRRTKKNACPYCNDIFAHENKSLKMVYPSAAKQYYRLNRIPVEKVSADKMEQLSYYKCNKCGIIQLKTLNEVISNKCSICENGFTNNEVKKIFTEINIPNHLIKISEILDFKRKVQFIAKCSECNQLSYVSLYDYFFVNRNYCLFCKGFDAIPGKTSLKALHPDLVNKYWDYLNNDVNPDNVLPTSIKEIYYKCPDCNNVDSISVNQMMMFNKRNINICSYCKGLRKNKIHFI